MVNLLLRLRPGFCVLTFGLVRVYIVYIPCMLVRYTLVVRKLSWQVGGQGIYLSGALEDYLDFCGFFLY